MNAQKVVTPLKTGSSFSEIVEKDCIPVFSGMTGCCLQEYLQLYQQRQEVADAFQS